MFFFVHSKQIVSCIRHASSCPTRIVDRNVGIKLL